LTFISQTQNLWLGFWSLFAFALGMGQLLLVVGLSGGLLKVLPKAGAWMNGVKYFFGIILLGTFYYYLSMLIPIRIWEGALGIGLVTLGGFFHYSIVKPDKPSLYIIKAFSMATLLFGAFLIFWSVMDLSHILSKQTTPLTSTNQDAHLKYWLPYSDQAYAEALKNKKPMIIDFYADWCASCHELDQKTFSQQKFIELTKDFTLLRFDATHESPKLKELKNKYKIVGLPTLVFYDRMGKLRPELEVNEFLTVEELEPILQQLK
jgi:thiol:disulfide interchange protein DsbD